MARHGLQEFYDALPIKVQGLLVSLAGYRSYRWRVGRPYQRVVNQLVRSDQLSMESLRADQDSRLREIIDWCAHTVPFYQEMFRREGIDPDSIRSVEDLALIPHLDKETVRKRSSELLSTAIPRRAMVTAQTSGTTGTALSIYHTGDAMAWKHAVTMRQRSWFGFGPNDRYAVFGGQTVVPFSQRSAPFWREDRARSRMLFSLYHMKDQFLEAYYDELVSGRYSFWQGYPSSVGILASFILDAGLELGAAAPRAVFTSSETLLDFHAERLEEATGAPIADLYSNAEFSVSALQCPEGRYHVDTEFCVLEIDPHEETEDWVRGEVISTGFSNRAMPFLRYRTGDVATLLKRTTCPCGRNRPILEKIDGRIEDYIVTPDGRRIGRMDHIFKGALQVREAQIVQDAPDHLLVRIVPRIGFREGERRDLERAFRMRVGADLRIDYVEVDEIPRERSGKFRAVVSEIDAGQLR